MVQSDSQERPRGILTKSDREFLLSGGELDGEYADPAAERRKRWHRIQQRILDSLADFQILTASYPNDRLEKLYEKMVDEADDGNPEYFQGATAGVEFLFRFGLEEMVEAGVRSGVQTEFFDQGSYADPTVDLAILIGNEDVVPFEDLAERPDDELTEEQQAQLDNYTTLYEL